MLSPANRYPALSLPLPSSHLYHACLIILSPLSPPRSLLLELSTSLLLFSLSPVQTLFSFVPLLSLYAVSYVEVLDHEAGAIGLSHLSSHLSSPLPFPRPRPPSPSILSQPLIPSCSLTTSPHHTKQKSKRNTKNTTYLSLAGSLVRWLVGASRCVVSISWRGYFTGVDRARQSEQQQYREWNRKEARECMRERSRERAIESDAIP